MNSEVDRLVYMAADLIQRNGHDRKPGPAWRDAVRQLLERAPASQIEAAIRFAAEDPFWRQRVFSLPYLLDKWDSIYPQVPEEMQIEAGAENRTARWPALEAKMRANLGRARNCISGEPLTSEEIEGAIECVRARFLREPMREVAR